MKHIIGSIPLFAIAVTRSTPVPGSRVPFAVDLREVKITEAERRDILRRDYPSTGLTDNQNLFLAEIGIGTPPQRVQIAPDTGSPISWVDPDCNKAGIAGESACERAGRYTPASSNPAPVKLPAFDQNATYGDGSKATMVGYTDVWTWSNNTKVPNTPFSVATSTSRSYVGIMGLSPDTKYGFNGGSANYSLLNTMVNQGIIASRAFSMGFNNGNRRGSTAGSLVFGGVDKNTFSGSFFKVPILPQDQGVPYKGSMAWRYWIQTTGVRVNKPDGTSGALINTTGFASKFLLDSGTTATYLDRDLLTSIQGDMAGATRGYWNCKINGSVEFFFGENSIKVPYGSFASPLDDAATLCSGSLLLTAGNGTRDGNPFSILGLGFLKAATAIFDWDNQVIHLAQGGSCGQRDVVPFRKGPGLVPNVKGNCK